jgi:hypothetical protein
VKRNVSFKRDPAKEHSLVFAFDLKESGSIGPEPDFFKWMDSALFMDVGIAADSFIYTEYSPEERKAWRLYHDALEATENVIRLFKENPSLFQKVAREMSFLPCFLSWHPDSQRFNKEILKCSQLGKQSMYGDREENARHMAHQSWPVRYAYAITTAIDLTLDCHSEDLPIWAEIYGYGVPLPITPSEVEVALPKMTNDEEKRNKIRERYRGAYRILPNWTRDLELIHRPFNKENVLDYWKKGKEIIMEELPEFHMRPEWQSYRDARNYQHGAKSGAIQHAIFKDILVALKTMANKVRR